MPDDIQDIRVTEDLDITLGSGNDIATTDYEDTPLQSVFIHVKNAIEPYVGEVMTPDRQREIATAVSRNIVNLDPQIDSVDTVNVEYDGSNEVSVSVGFIFDSEYETVEVQSDI